MSFTMQSHTGKHQGQSGSRRREGKENMGKGLYFDFSKNDGQSRVSRYRIG